MIGASDITSFSEVELRHSPRGDNCDRKSTRLNSSHGYISYAVFCLKKKKNRHSETPDICLLNIPILLPSHPTPATDIITARNAYHYSKVICLGSSILYIY